jgi:hypothetical protein
VDGHAGAAALGGEVVAALRGGDLVLGDLGPADAGGRLELGDLELAVGLDARVLDGAGIGGADTGGPSVVFLISRTRALNFGSLVPSARKLKTSSIGRSITVVPSNRPAMGPPQGTWGKADDVSPADTPVGR